MEAKRSVLTRRRFTCALIGLVAAAFRSTGANAADPKPGSQGVSLEGALSRDVFRALVGQEFSLLLANRAATLVLVRVDEDAARPDGTQFNVVFQGAADLKVLEGTYGVTHATAGTTLLYLRPTGRDGRYTYYEAPFNVPPDTAPATAPTRQPRRYERPLYEPRR
jgi:hypothetical protein